LLDCEGSVFNVPRHDCRTIESISLLALKPVSVPPTPEPQRPYYAVSSGISSPPCVGLFLLGSGDFKLLETELG